MRYSMTLGPFHPNWPGTLHLALEVEEGIVVAAEAAALRPRRAEGWAGLSLAEAQGRVERLCAAMSSAYALAFAQSVESLAGWEVPPRARYGRVLLAELERVGSHLWHAGRILRLAGLPSEAEQMEELREAVLRVSQQLTGARFFPGLIVPGGLARDLELEALPQLVRYLKGPLYRLAHRVISGRLAVAPLIGAGLLTKEQAEERGMGGPVARGSESERDLRRDQPYAAYAEMDPQVVTQGGGDVFARWMVLVLEVFESLRLLETVWAHCPKGPVRVAGGNVPAGEAQSRVESPGGPLVVRVQVNAEGRLDGFWHTPPTPLHRAVLPETLPGQRLDLVAVIVASWSLCPACLQG